MMSSESVTASGPVPPKRARTSSEGSLNAAKRKPGHKAKIHLCPPSRQGMTSLDKKSFDKDISVPTVVVYEDQMSPQLIRQFHPFLLKIQGIRPIQEDEDHEEEKKKTEKSDAKSNGARKTKKILLNPDIVRGSLVDYIAKEIKLDSRSIHNTKMETIKFTYQNWTWGQIFDSVLPDDQDKVSSFSHIGHLLHLNLRDHLLPYKTLIGQVFLDKVPGAKTVVNKLNNIDTTYRNFAMEILAGDSNTVVHLKENRCEYEFDFKDVYWNPRLSAEHERIVRILQDGDIMYDVFAGVGPFAVPAAKKKCFILANDLNPESFKWLQHNVNKNKVHAYVKCFNQDGRDFIKSTVANDIINLLKKHQEVNLEDPEEPFDFVNKKIHVVMNLPAIAVDFLDAFWGILKGDVARSIPPQMAVMVHVYCFIKDIEGYKEKALQLVEEKLKYKLPEKNVIETVMVRNVAPNKEMLRVSFLLPHHILKNDLE